MKELASLGDQDRRNRAETTQEYTRIERDSRAIEGATGGNADSGSHDGGVGTLQ
jgi:hypothetical protein